MGIIDELNQSEELKNFVKISEVPSAEEFYEIFSRYNLELHQYCKFHTKKFL